MYLHVYIYIYMCVRERVCVSNHVFQVEHHGLTLLSTSDMNCDQSAGHFPWMSQEIGSSQNWCGDHSWLEAQKSKAFLIIPAHHFFPRHFPQLCGDFCVWNSGNDYFPGFPGFSQTFFCDFHHLFYRISGNLQLYPAQSSQLYPAIAEPIAARKARHAACSTSQDWRWTKEEMIEEMITENAWEWTTSAS